MATITDGNGDPQSGIDVTFDIISGPNYGFGTTDTTDGAGEATFTYQGTGGSGTDVIEACYEEPGSGATVCSQSVTKIWNEAVCTGVDITITPDLYQLTNAVVGEFYSQQFNASGGTGPYTYGVTDVNDLPSGFSMSADGILSGTPDATDGSKNFTFTVTVTDDNGCVGSREYALVVCPGITLGPGTENLPNGFVGQFYSTTITESSPVESWNLTGDLPPGLSANPGSYIIEGEPTEAGTWTFTVTASTAQGCTASREYTIRILAAIPTLSEWGLIITAMALAALSLVVIRRRNSA